MKIFITQEMKKISLRNDFSFATADTAIYTKVMFKLIKNSWWVIAFALLSFFVYGQALKKHQESIDVLSTQLVSLNNERKNARAEQKRLLRQIASQNDPGWVELVLMRELGLTPEGQTKVYFR